MNLREAASLVLDQFLDEGRKIPIRAFVGGRRDPRFGRKARRFSSKAPLIDKGGELSVVDRFAAEHTRRPNAQLHTGVPLANFGPPAKNPKHRARQEALAHLYYHVGTYGKYKGGEDPFSRVTPGVSRSYSEHLRAKGAERFDEHQEMIDHINRLVKDEARSMRRAARRVVRKSEGLPLDNFQQEFQKTFNYPVFSEKGERMKRAGDNAESRHHDVQDHVLSGALPTDRGERLINMIYLERNPQPRIAPGLSYLLGGTKHEAHVDSMYKLAFERGVLRKMVHEHDPKKVLEMARKVRGR